MPVFNAYEATATNLRRKRKDSTVSTTATTTGKIPPIDELEKLGRAHGWAPGPVTPREVREWESVRYRWNEIFNRANLEAALESADREAEQAETKRREEVAPIECAGSAELKAWGEEHGMEAVELSMADIQRLDSKATLWHQTYNKKNFDLALQRNANAKHNREVMKDVNVQRMWRGQATAEEDRLARQAGEEFARRFPQFPRTYENAKRVARYMEENSLDATKVSSYVTAYKALVENGTITPAPEQSADAYLAQHPELSQKPVPPIIAARQAKAQATEEHFRKARQATATARSGATSFTDYPQEQHGVPPYNDFQKASFRNLVQNLTSAEFAERCKDPHFRQAVDKLALEK